MSRTAYLIAICHLETNEILSAAIWSNPEWEQSRNLEARTYVAFSFTGTCFAQAREYIEAVISNPRNRYHYLAKYLYVRTFDGWPTPMEDACKEAIAKLQKVAPGPGSREAYFKKAMQTFISTVRVPPRTSFPEPKPLVIDQAALDAEEQWKADAQFNQINAKATWIAPTSDTS